MLLQYTGPRQSRLLQRVLPKKLQPWQGVRSYQKLRYLTSAIVGPIKLGIYKPDSQKLSMILPLIRSSQSSSLVA